ncbi:sigma 54-interacting transcriptional regulator [Lewinella sp. JB7]|uniref:sigma 54-interacting transcriptional regulator n=1 Tax=Lewinella sp. JB7 TaxID=2962887 RepID=UPI0020C9A62C|nr:sigma 54-interacting transcriptional regulator [Lewinella sp. JB7]MCP9235831.1 sigma 54-interacting transcriptional regulator [Lewinella sp. JB7]
MADNAPPVDALLQIHQDAFDLVTEGVLWVDVTGRVQYGNESAASILGYTRNALLKASYFEINPHFSMMGWKKFWNRLQENQSERLDTEFVNRDGKLFSIKGRAGFDIYSVDPELCIVIFRSTEGGKRDADLLEAVQTDGKIGAWEVNLATNQVFLSPLIREWLALSEDRVFYGASEFLSIIQSYLVEEAYEGIRATYKDLRRSACKVDSVLSLRTPTLDRKTAPTNFIVRARSVENELEVYKVYGTLCLEDAAKQVIEDRTVHEELLQLAVDRHPDAVYIISSEDRRVIYANGRAVEMTGYSRDQLHGLAVSQLSGLGHEEASHIYRRVREERYVETQTNTFRKDGSPVPSHSRLYHYQRETKEYVLVVTRDLSQQSEDTENVQLYSTTLDVLQEWVVWLNSAGEIVLLNEAARKKLRRKTSRTIEGLHISEVMPDLSIPNLADVRQERIDNRNRPATEYLFSTTSGDDRTLNIRFAQVEAGAQSFLCLICRDVTTQQLNRRKLEKTKRRVDELTKQLQSENETLREQIEQVNTSGPIITVSRKYQETLAQIAQVSDTDATVLVTGETGTGKELLAQSIHKFSGRSRKPLISVNCAALPENLIESELFGHERGAFTGAHMQKKGKFELADAGTIFLDEIGELPLDMQAKLLRVLQEGEIQRIGSTESINVDVRVVAATNRDLEQMISEGKFREDLFYRLNVFPIHNLPLRERREDIPVLIKHFTKVYSDRMGRNITHINPRDMEQLMAYDFPGNVRELINLVERAVITSQSSTLNLSASLRALRRPDRNGESQVLSGDKIIPFEAMQKQYIIAALKRTNGKVTGPGGAAELLDLNGRTLMSKMNKLGINRNKFTS